MYRATAAVVVLIISCLPVQATADEWRPAEGKLMTRWARDVSPSSVWPEYPRPQMVRPRWTSLNGLWDYAIRPRDDERPSHWDGQILVPFPVESSLSGVGKPVTPGQRLWYRRNFTAPDRKAGERVLLHFGAVDWQCTIWLNGEQIGVHEGGFDPFSFDVTDALRDGVNEVALAVWDPTDAGLQPRGKQVLQPEGIWYTAVTGIWQTVWLEVVPKQYIKSLKIVPDVDRGTIAVDVVAKGGDRVRITATHGDQRATAEGAVGKTVEVQLMDPQLWSPDAPNLHDLHVELLKSGAVVNAVDSYCGMRKVEVRKDERGINRLFLNNQALFQYGPLDQGWWPDGLYTPATDDALRYDIEMTKKCGMNMARKHTKYECDRWYYWCDKLGLLVWQDMPSGNSDSSAQSRDNYRRELKAMVNTLHNHPSIVMWVPFNEGWGQHDTSEVVTWLQNYDPTRPVNEASGWHDRGSGQVSDMHNYPGPGMRPAEPSRASVLGEFGGLGMPIAGHTWSDRRNWGYVSFANAQELTAAYVKLLRAMRPLVSQGLSAAVYTQTTDVEIEVNGLMTYDREIVKMVIQQIADAAYRLYQPPAAVRVLVPVSSQEGTRWRMTTSKPASNWHQADFDDHSWKMAAGAFGTFEPRGGKIGTKWDTSDIWLRKSFVVDEVPANEDVFVQLCHDDGVDVYLNGQLVARRDRAEANYTVRSLPDRAEPLLKHGENTLAVHCHQTGGGQLMDAGLICLQAADDGWISLFNGRDLTGWKASEKGDSFHVVDGELVIRGPRSHLFYVGPVEGADFTNFEWKCEVLTKPSSNSGMYFHTEYQHDGWPAKGYEVQINNSHPDPRTTGGLYAVADVMNDSPVEDNEWFTQQVTVQGQRIVVSVNGKVTADYIEPESVQREPDIAGRRLSHGTFALQAHDPNSEVRVRKIMVRPLPSP